MGVVVPGARFADRYRIVRAIKRGGMAEVFEAVRLGSDGFEIPVAIKCILPGDADDPSIGNAFIDEARIVSLLSHANIVRVLDFGIADDQPYQVMELVDGLDLAGLQGAAVRSGQALPEAFALHVVTEVAHALAHVHGVTDRQGRPMGIVHRDISPDNILISWTGDVKLADFGIAFALHRLELTRTGWTKGKLSYMAPEQIQGRELDGRTDLYGLGCVLHRLLTGKNPERPARAEEVEVAQSIPEDLQRIIRRATRAKKDARYPTAAAFAADTGRALVARLKTDARTMTVALLAELRELGAGRPLPARRDELFEPEAVRPPALPGARREGAALDGFAPPARRSADELFDLDLLRPTPPPIEVTMPEGDPGADTAPPEEVTGATMVPDTLLVVPTYQPAQDSLRAVEPALEWSTPSVTYKAPAERSGLRLALIGFGAALGLFAFALLVWLLDLRASGTPPSSAASPAAVTRAGAVARTSTRGGDADPPVEPTASPAREERRPRAERDVRAERRDRSGRADRDVRDGDLRGEGRPTIERVEAPGSAGLAEAEAALARGLQKRGLTFEDLTLSSATRDPAVRLARAKAAQDQGAQRTETSALLSALEHFAPDDGLLQGKLARIEAALQRLSTEHPEAVGALDSRLIDLRVGLESAKTAAAREGLLVRMAALERAVAKAR